MLPRLVSLPCFSLLCNFDHRQGEDLHMTLNCGLLRHFPLHLRVTMVIDRKVFK